MPGLLPSGRRSESGARFACCARRDTRRCPACRVTTQAIVEAALRSPVSRETFARLEFIVDRIVDANATQNLISASSVPSIWSRHVADSLQLLQLANEGPWLDLGTGAGFPGLIIAAVAEFEMHLCEERRLRANFLDDLILSASLANTVVHSTKIQSLDLPPVAVISARAFAPLPKLLDLAHRFSTEKTVWVLPKGRNAAAELESVRRTWHGTFRLEPSVTDPDSHIIVATGVRRRAKR